MLSRRSNASEVTARPHTANLALAYSFNLVIVHARSYDGARRLHLDRTHLPRSGLHVLSMDRHHNGLVCALIPNTTHHRANIASSAPVSRLLR